MPERQTRLKTPASYRDTEVPVQRSIAQIESILNQFGADATSVAIARKADDAIAQVRFSYNGRIYSVGLALGADPKGQRQAMRMLFWYTKATFEAVLFGVLSAEEALLPFAEIADGYGGRTTVGKVLTGADVQLPATPNDIFRTIGMKALPAPARERGAGEEPR